MKWLLIPVFIIWFVVCFLLLASNYRVVAAPAIVPYCWEPHSTIPGFGRYLMCSEIDRYYEA